MDFEIALGYLFYIALGSKGGNGNVSQYQCSQGPPDGSVNENSTTYENE